MLILTLHHHKEISIMEYLCVIRTCTNREQGFDGPAAAAVSLCGSKTNVAKEEESGGRRGSEKKRLMQICERT